jgi:hypothetical protein
MRISCSTGIVLLSSSALFLLGCYPSWVATWPVAYQNVTARGTGAYTGGTVQINFDSIAPTMPGLPTKTSAWEVIPNPKDPAKGRVVFSDSVIGLKLNPADPKQPLVRDNGSICGIAAVPAEQKDTKVSLVVNTDPPPEGSFSQQGAMLHWSANSWSSCFVNFAAGESHIWRAKTELEYDALGLNKIKNFSNKKAYRVEYTAIGQVYRCKVFDGPELVADTGDIVDKLALPQGASGYMVEVALQALDKPIQGSFSELSSVGLGPVVAKK